MKLKELNLMKNNVVIEIANPQFELAFAIKVINLFFNKNNIKSKLSIALDYNLKEEIGSYYPFKPEHKYRIFVNPSLCLSTDKSNYDNPFFTGYISDLTLFGVTIHEFTHFLQFVIYPNIIDDYIKKFPVNRFILNNFSDNSIYDEVAELISFYIINPYLFKLISDQHFNFFKSYFKPALPFSLSKAIRIYSSYPLHIKQHLNNIWKINLNINTGKFIKTI